MIANVVLNESFIFNSSFSFNIALALLLSSIVFIICFIYYFKYRIKLNNNLLERDKIDLEEKIVTSLKDILIKKIESKEDTKECSYVEEEGGKKFHIK